MLCVSHVAVRASRYLTNSSFGRVGGVRTRSSHSTSRTRAGPVWIKLLVRGRATGEQELKPRFVGEATIHLKQGLQRGIQLPFALLVCGWSTTGGPSLPISKPGRFRQCVFWSDSKGSNQKVGGSLTPRSLVAAVRRYRTRLVYSATQKAASDHQSQWTSEPLLPQWSSPPDRVENPK